LQRGRAWCDFEGAQRGQGGREPRRLLRLLGSVRVVRTRPENRFDWLADFLGDGLLNPRDLLVVVEHARYTRGARPEPLGDPRYRAVSELLLALPAIHAEHLSLA